MNKYIILPVLVISMVLGLGTWAFADDAATGNTAVPASTFSSLAAYDWVLIAFACILLLIIIILSNTLHLAMTTHHAGEMQKRKKSMDATPVVLVLLFSTLFAESANASNGGLPELISPLRMIMYLLIAVELVAIYVIIVWIKYFTGIQAYHEIRQESASESSWSFSKLWARINKLRPVEEEGQLDTGHSYDGIRELDNATPPWFTVSFAATIVFSIFYLYRYHVAYSAPNQIEEYKIAVAEARVAQKEYLAGQANLVDETNVIMLDAAGVAAGKALYAGNCVACHGAEGQGGVGPNLTDDYWIHGGSIKDVFKTIKYGVVEKGMKPWQEDFSANQIAQLASFVESLYGTNPPGAKEKQGELYDRKSEAGTAPAPVDSTGGN